MNRTHRHYLRDLVDYTESSSSLPTGGDEDQVLTKVSGDDGDVAWEDAPGAGSGATELSELSDVGVTTKTNRFALIADGDSFESRAIVEADISDLGTYLTSETSHADVVVDGDFTSNGFMKRTGAGTYAIDTSTYLTAVSEGAVTAHEGALTITESQVSDLGSYLESETSHANVPEDDQTESITGDWTFTPDAGGGIADYDITIGGANYGMIKMGSASIGRTSYNASNLDLDGVVLCRNIGSPATSYIEYAFADSSNNIRFALAKSGVGNATYNPRSMLIAGPAALDDSIVTVGYWQGEGIFDNLVCDTSGDGADLGVQNDLEVEGDIFTDSIKESTAAAGVTIDGLLIKDSGIPEAAITAHQEALSITESQISDLGSYITASGVTYENLSANSDIGTGATQVAQGDHSHAGYQADLDVPSQAEAEAGVATTERVWTAERIAQAIAALESGGSSKEYASFYLSTGGVTAVAATETTLVINSTSVNSDSGIFGLATNQVTVDKTADFEVSFQVSFNSGGSARTSYVIFLEVDSVEVAGTRTETYQRGYDSGDTAACSIIISVTSGEVFQLRVLRADGAGTVGYQDDNGTRLTFKEM